MPNKKLIAFRPRPDIVKLMGQFRKEFIEISDTAIINAALRFYLPHAIKGVDGNLEPVDFKPLSETMKEEIKAILYGEQQSQKMD